jgi:NAD(P)-dependent dehydrogenase (short-subunit alcohol dehydrogenase family)
MTHAQKVAIVTGASQGIGAGIVKGYRDAGYVVVANSRNIQKSADTGVIAVAGDIGERAVAETIVRTAVEHFGRIDTLVNNAGVYVGKPFTDFTVEDYRNVIHVNLDGFFHITQLVIPQMRVQKSGHIVQITTSMVDQPVAVAGAGLAALTKGGLDAVTRLLAIEYAKDGIRANAVAPGIIKTPMHAPNTHEFLANLHPVGRMGEVHEIVDAVLYLERAAFVTGETLNVDGGQHAGR